MIKEFFLDLDRNWKTEGSEPILLRVLGSTSLFLQCDYERGTKDSDILEIHEIDKEIFEKLKKLAGKDTRLAVKHGIYLDVVSPGLAFLPPKSLWKSFEKLTNFHIELLEVVDVVVSKLRRFNTNDIKDIKEMTDRNLVDPTQLVHQFELAKEQWLLGSRAHELPKIIENLHTVQRDFLLTEETPVELPDWLMEQI